MRSYKSKKSITELEFRIIERVKELRIVRNYSKMELSVAIGVANSFVGKVESYGHPDKYNFKHLYRIAKFFNLNTIQDLIPYDIPQHESVEIIYEMVPKSKRDGSSSKQLEPNILQIIPKKTL